MVSWGLFLLSSYLQSKNDGYQWAKGKSKSAENIFRLHNTKCVVLNFPSVHQRSSCADSVLFSSFSEVTLFFRCVLNKRIVPDIHNKIE